MKIHITQKIFFTAVAVFAGFLVWAPASMAAMPTNVVVDVNRVTQSGTFLVKVVNEPQQISGKFGSEKLSFFRSSDGKDWVAIVGVNVKKYAGTYWLVVDIAGQPRWKKIITVTTKKFPVTVLQFTKAQLKQGYSAKKLLETIINNSSASLSTAMAVSAPTPYFQKPFIYPLDTIKITGNYGDIRKQGIFKVQHLGADLQASMGTPVHAVNDGKVTLTQDIPEYGNTIIVDHGMGIYSLYLHLSEYKVKVGDTVRQGDVVALSGDTGYVTGPHLHFSMKVKGASVDPLQFIKTTENAW